MKFRRVNTAANKQPNFDPHSLTPEHTVFYHTGLLDKKYLHERLTLETNIDKEFRAIKIYISIFTTYEKPLFHASSTINMCYSDISNSDTDKVWYINFTTCLAISLKPKVSILIYSLYKTLLFIMALKRKICPRV